MEAPVPAMEWADKDPAFSLPQRRKMEILVAILLGLFLAALDQTIVGTALPTIVGDLHGSNELYTWVITIYLLTSTITGVFYGKLSDIYGRRLMLLIGVSIFLIGSALSGLSWSMESLILFRGIQGVGAGALFPISLAIIGDMFSPAERGRYTGLFGAVFGVSAILGPLLGGWLTDSFSWHWIFYVNIPIGLVTLYIIGRYLPSPHGERPTRKLDYWGAGAFTVAVSFLLLGLTNKQSADWAAFEVGGYLLISAVVGAVFLFIESRAAEPIVPLDLFRGRGYAVTILATFMASIGFFGAVVFLPRWFQFVQGSSPTESGLQTLALLAGVIVGSVGSGILVSRTGRYKWLITGALAIMSLGLFLLTGLNAHTDLPVLWVWMFLTGLGVGPTFSVFTIVVQSVVPWEKLGVATANLTFFRQIGGSVGLAIVGTIFGTAFVSRLQPELVTAGVPGDVATQISQQAGNADAFTQVGGVSLADQLAAFLPADLIPKVIEGIHQAFSLAIADSFWLGFGATLIALVVTAVALPELALRGFDRATQPGGTPATGQAAAAPRTDAPLGLAE